MKTIIDIIEKRLESGGAKTNFTFLDNGENPRTAVSLREIQSDALALASLLPKHSAVLIVLPQGIQFIKSFFGCLYAQALAVPVSIPTKNRGIENFNAIAADAKVSIILTNRSTLANLEKWFGADALPAGVKWILIDEIHQNNFDKYSIAWVKPEQTAFLQYTSGSTGKPKAVMVTHENIVANSEIIRQCFQNNSESVSVCWLPSFHDMGLIDGIIQPVFSNFPAVLMSPIHFLQKPARWFKAMTEFGASYSGAPNFAFDFCVERIKDEDLETVDLSRLRCLYSGSETIRAKTVRKFVERFERVGFSEKKFFSCYGLAEATLAVTASKVGCEPKIIRVDEALLRQNRVVLSAGESTVELVGCGKTYADTKLKIVNPETLAECAELEIGEIWAAGKSITAGYLNQRDASRKTFVERLNEVFLRTGDLGFTFKDELFVTGRIKDVIVIRGKNHYPQDIEQTTSFSHQALQTNSCAAFSTEVDDEEKLIVVQEIKRSFLREAEFEKIFGSILSGISRNHEVFPHDIVLIAPNTLPKTTSGKIQRRVCRDLWSSRKLHSLAHLKEYVARPQI